jgi:hypothetical protein
MCIRDRVRADGTVTFDGEDIAETLIGRSEASRQAPIHWRRPPDRKNAPPALNQPQPDLAVREGRWKLLCDYDGSNQQLYDLQVDESETTNLAAGNRELAARLAELSVAWHRSMPADLGPELGAAMLQGLREGSK